MNPPPQLACVVTRSADVEYRMRCLRDARDMHPDELVTTDDDSRTLRALAERCDVIYVYVDEGLDTFTRGIIADLKPTTLITLTHLSAEHLGDQDLEP